MKPLKTILLLLLVSTALFSQAQVSVGVKGGYSMAWEYYNTDLPEDADININAFNIAGQVYLNMGKYFAVGMEPGFAQRGAACIPGWGPIFAADTKYYLNYVEAPLMFSGRVPLFKEKMEVYGKVGYGISYMLSAKEEILLVPNGDWEPRTPIDLKNTSLLTRWDHGAYSGVGVGAKLGPGMIFAETEFYLGMVDAEAFNTSKNRSLDFNVGYKLTL